ncbi:MAG TPA: amidohydrolase family protein [Thermoanaerobaculia bacterium]|nr:amidohydrolase family protein [Thermoanaerobaculia bacterium]
MLIIENADVYNPRPLGRNGIVVAGGRIEAIGDLDTRSLARQLPCEVVDASDCIAIPGLIDPHVHLIGGSGEEGFASQTPEIARAELLLNGITTVVGTLGTDTTTRTLAALLAKVKGLRERHVSAYMWTGGYDARPLGGSIRDDIILIEEVIGAGEIAISDRRGVHFSTRELARLAAHCHVAGTLAGKAGILHLHVGEGRDRLAAIAELLDRFEVAPSSIYPTHVNRNDELVAEAAALTRRGVPVDFDVYERNLARWILRFDGDRALLTISSDAAINSPATLLQQVRGLVVERLLPMEEALALVTRNTANVLKLHDQGELAAGKRANIVLLDAGTLAVRHVIAAGTVVVENGELR